MNKCSNLAELKVTPLGMLGVASPAKIKAFNESGFQTLFDLLTFFPRRYVDRTNQVGIADAQLDLNVLVLCKVTDVSSRFHGKGREVVSANVSDSTGTLQITFFNQPWRKHQLKIGLECALFGKVALFGRRRQMVNPLVDLIGDRTGRIVPIYSQSEKFTMKSDDVPRVISRTLDSLGHICDPLPEFYRNQLGLITRDQAYRWIHVPESPSDHKAARQRIAFDELFRIQLHLVASKVANQLNAKGIVHDVGSYASKAFVTASSTRDGQIGARHTNRGSVFQPHLGLRSADTSDDLVSKLFASLGFVPTQAQVRVIGEIALDMVSKVPMHRLLQGDVGAGKTLIAVVAGLFAIQGGHQVALLAPTEVLAEQHFINISRLCNGLELDGRESFGLFSSTQRPLRVDLLTSKIGAVKKRVVLTDIASGAVDLVIGTHALLSVGVAFSKLGLVVVDEQHRFGVEQRSLLRERSVAEGGAEPDMLVMTATPIPRTAAMTIFGDLDYSVLDELPPGRTPIRTRWAKDEDQVKKTYSRLRSEVASSRQGYVVCPLVEDSEKIQAKSATAVYSELAANELRGLRLGLLHGQMSTADKANVMDRFRNREIDVLVSTTVIEVGVDVPNATVMIIQDAGRFGIAQIHQLRGRVGRGRHDSYCYLVETTDVDPLTSDRLDACVESSDGFFLAERDLELRGEGTLFGSRQKGRSDLRVASLARDKRIVDEARTVAVSIVGSDPTLRNFDAIRDELLDLLDEQEAHFLFRN